MATLASLALPARADRDERPATWQLGPDKSVPICFTAEVAKWRVVRNWHRANSAVENCKPPKPWDAVKVPASGWARLDCNAGGSFDCRAAEAYTQLSTAASNNNDENRWGIPGPTGPTGPTGATGAQGAMGPAGLPGLDGARGAQGPMGPVGPQGSMGVMGPQGLKGDTGATGAVGPAGAAGAAGPQGLKGDTGAAGPAGAVGAQGPQGPAGAQGAVGPMGPQGLQGSAGTPGIDGAMGPQGPQGLQGAKGDTGAAGPAGAAGAVGPAGPMGPAGPGVSAYANAEGVGDWGPTLSVAEHGSYVVLAKVVLTPLNPVVTPIATVHCTLKEIGVDGDILHDEGSVSAPVASDGSSAISLSLQAAVNVPGEGTVFVVDCTRAGFGGGLGTGFRYANSKVQALKVQELFSPSP